MLKQFNWWFLNTWRPLVLWLSAIVALAVCFGIQLDGIKGQFSQLELNYLESTSSIKKVVENPEFLPHKVLTLTLQKLNYKPDIMLRLPSAIVGTFSILVGLIFFRRHFSARMTFIIGVLIISSSWFLSLGRLALPDISFLWWVPLLSCWSWLRTTNKKKLALFSFVIVISLSLYIPSLVFFILLFWLWQKRYDNERLYINNWLKALCLVVFLLFIAPLLYSAFIDPKNILPVLGLPTTLPPVSIIINSFLNQVGGLFFLNNSGPIYTVGRLPLLDIFTTVFFLLGLYLVIFKSKQTVWFWAPVVGFYIILMSLGGPLSNAILLPLIYFLAAYGLRFFLQQWFTVFPNNPIARSVGTSLVMLAVVLVAFYHAGRYFIVWANAPATRQTFNNSLLE